MRKNQQFPIQRATVVRRDEAPLRRNEPKDQQTKMLRVCSDKGHVAQKYVHSSSVIFKDLYKRGHVLGFGDEQERTKLAFWGWRSDLLREKTLPRGSPLLFLNEQYFGTR